MSIRKMYKTTVSTQRLGNVSGSKKETYQTNISNLRCHIQPISGESSAFATSGGFYTTYKMYCRSDADIQEADRVISGSSTYTVQGVLSRNFGRGSGNKHLEVLLAKGK